MIRRRIKNILEDVGFELKCNEYVGDFLFDPTGNIVTIIAKESEDDNNLPRLIFDVFDQSGELLSSATLDQILNELDEMNLSPIIKPSKQYVTTYKLKIQVPIDIGKMSKKEFMDYIKENGCDDAVGVAELAARITLGDFLKYCPFNIIEMEPNGTEELTLHNT